MAAKIVEYAYEVKTKQARQALKDTGAAATQAATSIEAAQNKTVAATERSTNAVRNSAKEWRAFRKEGANIDRLTGELAGGLSLLSPSLGAMATAASLAGGAVEALGRAMSVVNVRMLAGVAAFGVIVGAYKMISGATKEAEKEAKRHAKQLDELDTAATAASASLYDLAAANEELKDSEADQEQVIQKLIEKRYELLGLADEEDLKMIERDRKTRAFAKKQISIAQDVKSNLQKINTALFKKMNAVKKHMDLIKKDGKVQGDTVKILDQLQQRWKKLSTEQGANQTVLEQVKSTINSFETDGVSGFGNIADSVGRFEAELRLLDKTMAQVAAGEIPGAPKKRSGGGGSRRKKRAAEVEKSATSIEERLEDTYDVISDLADEAHGQIEEALKLQLRRLQIEEQSISNRAKINEGIVEGVDLTRMTAINEERASIQLQLKNEEMRLYKRSLTETLDKQKESIEAAREELKTAKKNRAGKKKISDMELEIATMTKMRAGMERRVNILIEKQAALIDEKVVVSLLKAAKATKEVGVKTNDGNRDIERLSGSIKILEKQFLGVSKDPFVKLADSTEKIREQIQKIKDTEPFGESLKNLNSMEKTLKSLEKKARLKIEADIKINKIKGFLSQLQRGLGALLNPGELVKLMSTGIGSMFGGIGGEIGSAIGGLIGGIAELGKKSPEEIKAEFENFIIAFRKGIDYLPMIFEEILPPFVAAIAKLIPVLVTEIIVGITRGFAAVLSGAVRLIVKAIEMGPANIVKAIGGWFARKWDELIAMINRFFDAVFSPFSGGDEEEMRSGGRVSARSGISMTGGAFGSSTLARLHPGEFVVPQSGMKPQAVERTIDSMGSGGGLNLVINSAVTERSAIDELVRKIENKYRTFGTSKSPLFAS